MFDFCHNTLSFEWKRWVRNMTSSTVFFSLFFFSCTRETSSNSCFLYSFSRANHCKCLKLCNWLFSQVDYITPLSLLVVQYVSKSCNLCINYKCEKKTKKQPPLPHCFWDRWLSPRPPLWSKLHRSGEKIGCKWKSWNLHLNKNGCQKPVTAHYAKIIISK